MEQIKIEGARYIGKKRLATILEALGKSSLTLGPDSVLQITNHDGQGTPWTAIALSLNGWVNGVMKWDVHTGWQCMTRDEAMARFLEKLPA